MLSSSSPTVLVPAATVLTEVSEYTEPVVVIANPVILPPLLPLIDLLAT